MTPVNCNTVEIWMPIFGYEGIYEISSRGKVNKFITDKDGRKTTKRMKTSLVGANREYLAISLTKDHKTKLFCIHRLVAEAFNGLPGKFNPDGTLMRTSPEINHIDGDTKNNIPENLEWCDRYYNNSHRRPASEWNYTRRTIGEGRKPVEHSEEYLENRKNKLNEEIQKLYRYIEELNNREIEFSCNHSDSFYEKQINKVKEKIKSIQKELDET